MRIEDVFQRRVPLCIFLALILGAGGWGTLRFTTSWLGMERARPVDRIRLADPEGFDWRVESRPTRVLDPSGGGRVGPHPGSSSSSLISAQSASSPVVAERLSSGLKTDGHMSIRSVELSIRACGSMADCVRLNGVYRRAYAEAARDLPRGHDAIYFDSERVREVLLEQVAEIREGSHDGVLSSEISGIVEQQMAHVKVQSLEGE